MRAIIRDKLKLGNELATAIYELFTTRHGAVHELKFEVDLDELDRAWRLAHACCRHLIVETAIKTGRLDRLSTAEERLRRSFERILAPGE